MQKRLRVSILTGLLSLSILLSYPKQDMFDYSSIDQVSPETVFGQADFIYTVKESIHIQKDIHYVLAPLNFGLMPPSVFENQNGIDIAIDEPYLNRFRFREKSAILGHELGHIYFQHKKTKLLQVDIDQQIAADTFAIRYVSPETFLGLLTTLCRKHQYRPECSQRINNIKRYQPLRLLSLY